MLTRSIILVAAGAVLGVACAPPVPASGRTSRAHLQEREASFMTALAAKDPAATAAHFTDDAVLHVADMPPIRGREAIHRFYANIFRSLDSSTATTEVVRSSLGDDLGYSIGRVTNVFTREQGAVAYEGKYLLVWERRGDEWSIASYSISSNQGGSER